MTKRSFLRTICGAVAAAAISLRMAVDESHPQFVIDPEQPITVESVYRYVAEYLQTISLPEHNSDFKIITPRLVRA